MSEKKSENEEINAIAHLIQVEKQANELVSDAVTEAEKRLNAAKIEANEEFKKQYEKIVLELEKSYEEKIKKVQENHAKIIEDYKISFENKVQNATAFNQVLDSLLKI